MNKKFIGLAVALGLLFAGLGIYAGNRQTTPKPPADKSVAQLMAQQFKDSEGKPQSMAEWQGKFLVVNFWATWCAPCVQEMPELSAMQDGFKGKSIQILGLGIDSPTNIADFAKKYKISYPLFSAGMEGSELSRQLGNTGGGLPFTVLINAEGKVVKSYLGRLKMDELHTDIAKYSLEK